MMKKGWYRRLAAAIPLAAMAFLLGGCQANMGVLDPQGTIAKQQLNLIYVTTGLCLVIIVPTLVMVFVFAWKYRSKSKKKTEYKPDWSHSKTIEAIMWGIPILIILLIGIVTVRATYNLEPSKALESDVKPITIEATSLDWKWLFTYPDLGIATVNYVEFPANVPVHFKLTADSPMNSFWIPQLGGQIYTMSGMAMNLNLQADKPGEFPGRGANFTGAEFGKMSFIAKATTQDDFDKWVSDVKASSSALTQQGYDELAEPGVVDQEQSYSAFPDGLFERIVNKYKAGADSGHHHGGDSGDGSEAMGMGGMDMDMGAAGDSSQADNSSQSQ